MDLHNICLLGNAQELRTLLQNNPSLDLNIQDRHGNTALHIACCSHQDECIQLLIKAGADPSIKNNEGMSLLHRINLTPNTMKILLEAKCSIDESDPYGDTPLHYNCFSGNIEAVKLLIEYGANPFSVNNRKMTPLDDAISIKQTSLYDNRNLDEIIAYLKSFMEVDIKEPDILC